MTSRSPVATDESLPPNPLGDPDPEGGESQDSVQPVSTANPGGVLSWLERARRLADRGRDREAYELLGAILKPVLEAPAALEVWMSLARRLEPERAAGFLRSLQAWVRVAQSLLVGRDGREPRPDSPSGMVSRTLAELYWKQGYREKAEGMYRVLLQRDPEDQELRKVFRERFVGEDGRADTALRVLEGWARRIRRRKRGQDWPGDGQEG